MKSTIFLSVLLLLPICLVAQTPAGGLRAGAAKKVITPDPLIPLSSGGIGPQMASDKKLGDLFVRAMVLEKAGVRVAIVGIDNLGWPAVLGDRSRALIRSIPPENILIGATHTHSAPDAYVFPDENGAITTDTAYLEFCVQAIADAVEEAVERLEPASLRIAVGEARGKIAFNYYAERLYDPRVGVIQAVSRSEKDRVIATLVNYAIHPEIIGTKNGVTSPDLCGPLYDRIEEKAGGLALFMNSAQGGMVTADDRGPDGRSRGTWEEAVRIGNLLADESLRILEGAPLQEDPALYCGSKNISLPIESPMMRFILEHSPLPYQNYISDNHIQTRLNLLNIGTAQVVTIPGEALPNIGYFLKRNMKTRQPFLFGLTNDAFGYILTRVDFNSFERYDYISRTSLGEQTGEIYIEEALRLIAENPAASE